MASQRKCAGDVEEPFNIFWNEYHDIEQTSSLPRNVEEEEGEEEAPKTGKVAVI